MKRQFLAKSLISLSIFSGLLVSCQSTSTLDVITGLENLEGDERIRAYAEVLQERPEPELYYNKAYHELEAKNYVAAEETARKALDENPEFLRMQFLLILTYRETGKDRLYLATLEDIASKLPHDKEIVSLLVNEYKERRDYARMVASARELLKLDPHSTLAINALAYESEYMKAMSDVFEMDKVIEALPDMKTSSRIEEDEIMEVIRERYLLPFLFVTD